MDFRESPLGQVADKLNKVEAKLLHSHGEPVVLRECEEMLLVQMLRAEQSRLHNLWFVENSL